MDFDLSWLLLALPAAFALGWLASRLEGRQWAREQRASPKAYFKGLNLLLNEQADKAVDAFIEAVQQDPDTSELHFALGNLFRRRGEFERAVRVHEHLLARGDLPAAERERAQYALAQDFMKAGLVDRAEQAFRALEGTPFAAESRLALLTLYERTRDWRGAIDVAQRLERAGTGSFSGRVAHHWCEIALEADAKGQHDDAAAALARAVETAPRAPRAWLLRAQRAMRQGQTEASWAAWLDLQRVDPATLALAAREFVDTARAAGRLDDALRVLADLYRDHPGADLLQALGEIDPDAGRQLARLRRHLRDQPTLAAAQMLLRVPAAQWDDELVVALREVVARASRPVHRFRCAACGFEAQQFFWQCPGCLTWDSFPPQRIDEA